MKYTFEELKVSELINLIDKNKIDLNPSYQRNFIWSPKDQSELIDSILEGFPLPNFFIYEKPNGFLEMVDGQQRTTTIYNFSKDRITSTKKNGKIKVGEVRNYFLNYKLPIIFLRDVKSPRLLNDFYVLINKKGKHLNTPEVNKSEYYDKRFLKLANELLNNQNFIDLNLFTEATSKRMNDRGFVEELLGYLKLGIQEKRSAVETLLEDDISENDYEPLKKEFNDIIAIIHKMNEIKPLKKTRYRQKNDFYTLFSFVNENIKLEIETLLYQYRILLILNGEDKEGDQFIRPTNERCFPLKEYALNCVSQSNSKRARIKRLEFFNDILKNQNTDNNDALIEVLRYLGDIFGPHKIDLKKIEKFDLLNLDRL